MPLKVPRLDEPWGGFLSSFHAQLSGPVDFHCMGGFVVSAEKRFITAELKLRAQAKVQCHSVFQRSAPFRAPLWRWGQPSPVLRVGCRNFIRFGQGKTAPVAPVHSPGQKLSNIELSRNSARFWLWDRPAGAYMLTLAPHWNPNTRSRNY